AFDREAVLRARRQREELLGVRERPLEHHVIDTRVTEEQRSGLEQRRTDLARVRASDVDDRNRRRRHCTSAARRAARNARASSRRATTASVGACGPKKPRACLLRTLLVCAGVDSSRDKTAGASGKLFSCTISNKSSSQASASVRSESRPNSRSNASASVARSSVTRRDVASISRAAARRNERC